MRFGKDKLKTFFKSQLGKSYYQIYFQKPKEKEKVNYERV